MHVCLEETVCVCVSAGLREWVSAHTNWPQSLTCLPLSWDDIVAQRITSTVTEIELVLLERITSTTLETTSQTTDRKE